MGTPTRPLSHFESTAVSVFSMNIARRVSVDCRSGRVNLRRYVRPQRRTG
jgi:hypothetical protein